MSVRTALRTGKINSGREERRFSIFHFPFVICHFSERDAADDNDKWKMTNGK